MWQSFSAIHNVKWDHDCSSIPSLANPLSASWQLQVSLLSSLPWPSSPLSSNFPLQLSQGPHWEYCSDPGLWAPKPTLILRIDRPENFLPSAAGSSALTPLNNQHFSVRETEKMESGTLPFFSTDGSCWCDVCYGYSRWHVARESAGVVASLNSIRLWSAQWSSCFKMSNL